MQHKNHYTLREEIANSVTHGVGVVFSIVALTLLVTFASFGQDPWRIVTVTIFGTTMLVMFLASTLYHALPHPPVKRALRVVDHCAIYCLIAGTYTPFLLVCMRGVWGWSLFALLWTIALAGCIYKICFIQLRNDHITGWRNWVSTGLYVAMGWTIVIAAKPTLEMVPVDALVWVAIGGLLYTAGVIFYLWERLPYNHAIWHCFVLGGSVAHFIAIFAFIAVMPAA
ncbi:MAG: hemolysin III family protein [Candidatus Hydrogenedentes bacterium]|nr:hemolysin III family protein [Candidatus Hydrogenedentota bacterium]